MAASALHIVPDDSFDDWIVRDDSGRELGHYPTREAAELVAQALARKLEGEIVIHFPDGRTSRTSRKGVSCPIAAEIEALRIGIGPAAAHPSSQPLARIFNNKSRRGIAAAAL